MVQFEQQPPLSSRNSPRAPPRALPGVFSEGAPVIPEASASPSSFFTGVLPLAGVPPSFTGVSGAPKVLAGVTGAAGFGGAGLLKAGRSFLSELAIAALRMAVCTSCTKTEFSWRHMVQTTKQVGAPRCYGESWQMLRRMIWLSAPQPPVNTKH